MKYTLVQKAWELNLFMIYDPYHLSRIIHHGKTIGDAKSKIYSEAMNKNLSLTDGPITYLNIPIKRCKEADKYLFEDQELALWKIKEILLERKRITELEIILNDNSISHAYIRKGGYYYKSNYCGYSEREENAGVYSKQEAVSHAKSCREIIVVPINIQEHNKMLQNKINDIKTRIIESII